MIRPARLSDAPEIARLHVDAWPGPAPGPSLDQRLELWHHVLGGGARRVQAWVALDDRGQVTGVVSAGAARVLRGRFDGEVTALYVAPASQRQGVGSALLREALAGLRAQGLRNAMAWTPATGPAREFLLARGARPEPDRRRAHSAQGSDQGSDQGAVEAAVGWPDLAGSG